MSFNDWMGDRVNNIGRWAENIVSNSPDKKPTQFQSWAAETFPNINRWMGGSPSGGGNQPPNKPPNSTISTPDPGNTNNGGNMGLAAAAPIAAAVAPQLLAMGVDSLSKVFGGGEYTTQQANDQMKTTTGESEEQTLKNIRDQLQNSTEKAVIDDLIASRAQARTADILNRGANAATSRSMALDTVQNMNRMYANMGDRVNQGAANTMQAVNNAAQAISGAFR